MIFALENLKCANIVITLGPKANSQNIWKRVVREQSLALSVIKTLCLKILKSIQENAKEEEKKEHRFLKIKLEKEPIEEIKGTMAKGKDRTVLTICESLSNQILSIK